MNWLKQKITARLNGILLDRANAEDWLIELILLQDFPVWFGNPEEASQNLIDTIIFQFEDKWIQEALNNAARFYRDIHKEKAPEIMYPRWKQTMIVNAFEREQVYWTSGIEDRMKSFELNGAGTTALYRMFAADWDASLPEMKLSKNKENENFRTGAGRFYAPLWKALDITLKKQFTRLNTEAFTLMEVSNGR